MADFQFEAEPVIASRGRGQGPESSSDGVTIELVGSAQIRGSSPGSQFWGVEATIRMENPLEENPIGKTYRITVEEVTE